MKKRRVIGIILIIMSLLLQVSYAAVYNLDTTTMIGSKEYNMAFEKIEITTNNQYIDVSQLSGTETALAFSVKNLYPGASFTIKPTVKNWGSKAVKVTDVIVVLKNQDSSDELAGLLRGYDANGNSLSLDDYNAYLKQYVQNTILNSGETQNLSLSLGLDHEQQQMQELKTEFSVILKFKQNEEEVVPVPTSSSSPDSSEPSNTLSPVIEDEEVPGNPTEDEQTIEDEEVPATPVITDPTVEVEDEEIPLSPVVEKETVLPKTGGIATPIVFIIGIAILICGVLLARKKE